MAFKKSAFLALYLATIFARALHAQENGNGIVLPGLSAGDSLLGDVPLGGPWIEFGFGATGTWAVGCQPADPGGVDCSGSSGGNSQFGDAPPWTFTAPDEGATLAVTDAFLIGDQFEVFDFDVLIGTTSTPGSSGSCGDDPEPCRMDPLISYGLFSLAPGAHEITIRTKASPFGSGAAYFRVDFQVEPSALDFYSLPPCRVVDTRSADGPYGGPVLASDQLRDFLLAGQCGIPNDAHAVALNVTIIDPTGGGRLRLFAAGTFEPFTSSLNFSAGQIRSNNGIVGLFGGSLSVRALVNASPGTAHVVIDVYGYFR